MGCCLSRGDDGAAQHPYPPADADAGDGSSRNITAGSPARTGSAISARASHASHHHTANAESGSKSKSKSIAPNAPLKLLDPTRRCALPTTLPSSGNPTSPRARTHVTPLSNPNDTTWTRSRLAKERKDWWDTRVTGQRETWAAIQLCVEYLQANDLDEAQAILDASGCTCPHGEIWRGVFGETGEWYKIPEWLIIEPAGLVEDPRGNPEEDDDAKTDDEDSVEGSLSREKGKGKATAQDLQAQEAAPIHVKCRISDTAEDFVLQLGTQEKLKVLVQRLRHETGIFHSPMKLLYAGRFLDEHKTLLSQCPLFADYHVLVVYVYREERS